MGREILFPAGTWPVLRTHLLDQGEQEQLAFLLAGTAQGHTWIRLLVREIIPVPPEAFEHQTATHLVVKPAFSRAILRRCCEEGLSLIEVHSHPFARQEVMFSATDLANEVEKFRYVAHKIPHIRHATLVVGQTGLDAHLWDGRRHRAVPVDRVRVLGNPIVDLLPTSSCKKDEMSTPCWDRQVLAFGAVGQQRLQNVRVGVVGCGGTGSVVAQMLAHLGVQCMVLVDPDTVEFSNLNRLVGATPTDARLGRLKVHVARRLVQRINPVARVRTLPVSVSDPRALSALKSVDFVFGCTDNHGSRLILNQLAVQYLLPYMDLGTGLQAASEGQLIAAGGQVRLIQPGDFCLSCIDGIDRSRAAQDLMSSLERQRQIARGYIRGFDVPTPAVLFLNSAIASQAVAEFVNVWTGYKLPTPLLYFDLLHSRLTPVRAERQTSCVACGEGGSLALGDLEPLFCTEENQLPDIVPTLQQ